MTEASDISFGLEVTKGLVAKFLMAIIGFGGSILFARILGPVSFGSFYLVWSVVSIAKLPVDGFGGASMKRFSESDAHRSEILGATLLVIAVTTVAATAAAVLVQGRLASYTGIPNAHVLFGLLFATVSLFTPLQGMLSGTGKVSRTIWVDLIRSVFTTPFQLGFILLGTKAAGMAYGLSLATALTVPITYALLKTRPATPDWGTITHLWSFARFNAVATTLGRVYSRLDILLLGALLAPGAAGYYEVAFKLTVPAIFVSEVAGDGLMARVSNLKSKGESVSADISNTLSFSSILAIPLFFGGAVLADPLVVTVYGAEYTNAAPLLIGLALYRVFQTQSTPLIQSIRGLDKPEVTVWISALTLALNVPLGVGLTLQIGAVGVVIATVIAEATKYLLSAAWIRRTYPAVDVVSRQLLEQICAGAVMAGTIWLVHQWVPVRSWAYLLALVGTGGILYGSCLLMVSSRLRHTVLNILGDVELNYGL